MGWGMRVGTVAAMLVLVLWTVGRAESTEIPIAPSVDGTIIQAAAGDTTVQAAEDFFFATLNSSFDCRAVVEFPLADIPAGVSIVSATLILPGYQYGGTLGDVGTFELHGSIGDGVVTVGDARDAEFLSEFTVTVGLQPDRDFDVTSFVQTTTSGGAEYVGFMIKALSPNIHVGFASLENSAVEKHALLRVVTNSVLVERSTWGLTKARYR